MSVEQPKPAIDPKSPASQARPVVTLASLVPLSTKTRPEGAEDAVSTLRRRGYNTAVVPVLQDGEVLLPRARPRNRREREAPGLVALQKAIKIRRNLSSWIYVDPLSAGPRRSGRLGTLALENREWLLRNTAGHLTPVGNEESDPLFSWMNREYRTWLGDLLVELGEALPFTGVVIDLRRFPGTSENAERWYCCSFDSQIRAEEQLGISFERLLATGTRLDIRRWQEWVVSQMRQFVHTLVARMLASRQDITWTLLVPHVESLDPFEAPWTPCLVDGLVDELIVMHDEKSDFVPVVEHYDSAARHPTLIMPGFTEERAANAQRDQIYAWPTTGLMTLSWGQEAPTEVPERIPPWRIGGAMEDYPLDAVCAMAAHIERELGQDSQLGRYYGEQCRSLENLPPDNIQLERARSRMLGLRERIHEGTIVLPEGHEHLRREIEIIARLMQVVKLPTFQG